MPRNTEIVKIGSLIDPETGEIFQTKTTTLMSRGFTPYLHMGRRELLRWIECSDTPKDKVKAFIIRKVSSDNIVSATTEEIAKAVGVGANTVTRTMNDLADADLLKSIGYGKWMLNPKYFYQGKSYARESMQSQYLSFPESGKRKKAAKEKKQGDVENV